MRRVIVTTAALAGALGLANPAWAVRKSSSLLVTDLGQAVPGATITLSRPHPRHARAKPKPPLQQQQQQQQVTSSGQNGPPLSSGESPPPGPGQPSDQGGQNSATGAPAWIVVKTDGTSRIRLRYDDRDAPPGSVVDITVTFVNGETLRRTDVPIEQITHGGTLEIEGVGMAAGSTPPPGGQPTAGQAQQGQPTSDQSPGTAADTGQGSQPGGSSPDGPPPDSEPGGPSSPDDGSGGGIMFGLGGGSSDSHHHH